jgi:hypothetical protein
VSARLSVDVLAEPIELLLPRAEAEVLRRIVGHQVEVSQDGGQRGGESG